MRVEADSGMRKQKEASHCDAFIAASLAAAVSLVFALRRKAEPIYAGCTLSYWADRYAKAYFSQRAFLSPT